MNRLKSFKEKLRGDISFMTVPGADKKIRHLRIPKTIFYGGIALLTVSVISINSALVFYFFNNTTLRTENLKLSASMADKNDRISRLETLYASQLELNTNLKSKAQQVAIMYEERLTNLESLENQAITLISKLNTNSDVNISVPVSRSFQRSGDVLKEAEPENYDSFDDSSEIDALLALISDDEISQIVSEQLTEYSTLIDEVENTLDFLECRPDLKPVEGTITSGFGMRRDPVTGRSNMHKGLDIANTPGTPVRAAGSGVVTYSGYSGSYGNIVVITHGYGYKSVYAHNNKNLVDVGDPVKKGQQIAELGSTGKSTGPHVHFEVHYEGIQIDPAQVIK